MASNEFGPGDEIEIKDVDGLIRTVNDIDMPDIIMEGRLIRAVVIRNVAWAILQGIGIDIPRPQTREHEEAGA